MRTFVKTVLRTINSHRARFLAMVAIVALSVGFITGVAASPPNMRDSVDKYYDEYSTADIIIKAPRGLSTEQQNSLKNNLLIESVQEVFCADMEVNELTTRLCFLPLERLEVNKLELLSGSLPKSAKEVLVERGTHYIKELEVGDTINYLGQSVTVSGIVANSLYFSKEQEPSYIENKHLEIIIYFNSDFYTLPVITSDFYMTPVMGRDLYIKVADVSEKSMFSDKYVELVNTAVQSIEGLNNETNPIILLTLNENTSYMLYKSNADKIEVISYIFPVFFLLVAALVVLTTMTRLVDEERASIGCYSTLGYSSGTIKSKYITYALICSILGSLIGMAFGCRLVPMLVYNVYSAMFDLPSLANGFYYSFGIIAAIIMMLILVVVSWSVVSKTLKDKPAELLRQKAPMSGKKIFLEKIPFIWKRLKFKYKSTFRNVFRYVQHFIMTVLSIAGCTALVLAGLGLYDSINKTSESNLVDPQMLSSIVLVSVLLIVAAAMLSFIVLYNLTNMNIEERKKEIATLKVLGYKPNEVAGYIFREVLILTCIGITVGLPIGYGLLNVILVFMKSDAIAFVTHVNWYSFPLCILLNLLFSVIVDLLLYRKITRIDMNASLKANE